MQEYEHLRVEKKWQQYWDKNKTFEAKNASKKQKFYGLIEFPYPSGSGLHVGHIRSNTAMDIISRKRRMEGYNVLYPIGWDAFGLPTENYAIKTGIHPVKVTKDNTDTFRRQLKALGFSFDWSREVDTTDPKYYKWTQWIFLQFFKKGLAYKTRTEINWCPNDKIGLANEEVVGGLCDRCGRPTEKREKEQWMLAITKYAERLDQDLDLVNYLPKIKTQQRNWIGKSEGAEIDFRVNINRNYIFLHGFEGSPKEPKYAWIKNELEKTSDKVFLPQLPNANKPTEEEQVGFILKNAEFNKNTVLCGKSLGAVVALKILEKLDKPIAGLVLIGGFLDGRKLKSKYPFENTFKWNYDFEKIKSNVGFIKILHDKKDRAVPGQQAELLHKNLGGELIEVIAEQPHFGAEQEPSVIDTIVPKIKVFTTRPDTIFGATYLVLAPEHPLIKELAEKSENKDAILRYIVAVKKETDIERTAEDKEKTGVELKGVKAINPATGAEIPIWIADYVLAHYGTGAIMAVPADDARDREFAEKFGLPIVENYKKAGSLDFGRKITRFKLRDWVFSRQRYWGEPIPLINCGKCGWVPVPEKDLPVELPKVKNYQPTDSGESPLANISKWVNTKCPTCKGPAKRETDTMPNWAGSSWYFLRYTDPKNSKALAGAKNLKYWTPVDWYNGGMEHTTLHLLYSRFWHKFLYDLKIVPTPEPYIKRTSHGMILGEGGVKMSKSLGNVVNPDDLIKTYGADTLRLYEMFMGPFDQSVAWSTDSLIGPRRFLEKVWRIGGKVVEQKNSSPKLLHKTIKKVTEDIEGMNFNTAIASLMILATEMDKSELVSKEDFKNFLKLLSPFAPHITEELWNVSGEKKSIAFTAWPKWDEKLVIDQEVKIAVQVNGKVRAEILVAAAATEGVVKAQALADVAVAKYTTGQNIKKVIYVPGRLINIVL